MTVTNTSEDGCGICMSNAEVELIDVAFIRCKYTGLRISDVTSQTTVVATRCEFANSTYGAVLFGSLTSATFNNCVFHDNSDNGIHGCSNATTHLHGEATAIHSNGIGIAVLTSGKVLIHLPSHHNTCYNNRESDRRIFQGTITNVED